MKLFATRHSHAELYVHVVWATSGRVPVLCADILEMMRVQSLATARKVGSEVIAFGGIEDHLHQLLRYRPDLSVSELVRTIKGALTRTVRREVPALPDFGWQEGYGAFSVSGGDVDRIASYILNQEQHHLRGSVVAELEGVLAS